MVTQNVNLTQTTKKIPSIVHVVQGDSGRQVVAKVTDQTISGTASMSFERPDGAVYTSTATINTTDNTMSVNLTSDMLNIAGNAKITFKVTTSNKTVSTFTLVAVIEPSAGFGQTPSTASNKIYVYVNGSAVEIAKQTDVTSLTSRVGANETNIIAINNDLVHFKEDLTDVENVLKLDYENIWVNMQFHKEFSGVQVDYISDTEMKFVGTATSDIYINMDIPTAYMGNVALAVEIENPITTGNLYIATRNSSGSMQFNFVATNITKGQSVHLNKNIGKVCFTILKDTVINTTVKVNLVKGTKVYYPSEKYYDVQEHDLKVYHVEKDGSGDFTKLVDAIEEAEKYMDSTVYLGKGTWNILEELGTDYINSVSSTKRGIYLKNRIKLICSSDAIITCNYDGSRVETVTWLAVFNSGEYGFTLENATIECTNIRYAVHDERDEDSDGYTNKYINCNMKIDNSGAPSRPAPPCIGGGLGLNGNIIIDGCVFETVYNGTIASVTWHNSSGSGKSHISVRDCYFKNQNRIRLNYYGQSQKITNAEVCGCSMWVRIEHGAETSDGSSPYDNLKVTEWNNTFRTS